MLSVGVRASANIEMPTFYSAKEVSLIALDGEYAECLPGIIIDRLESMHCRPYEVFSAHSFCPTSASPPE
jgi:hypothetical protein